MKKVIMRIILTDVSGYRVSISKTPGSPWYVAEVPALPGCVSQGKTKKKVLINIKDAMQLWLETQNEKSKDRKTS